MFVSLQKYIQLQTPVQTAQIFLQEEHIYYLQKYTIFTCYISMMIQGRHTVCKKSTIWYILINAQKGTFNLLGNSTVTE